MVSDSERIRELEERLEQLERELKSREGGHLSHFLESLLPAEVREHMRAAAREQMLAVSSYLSHMAGKASDVAASAERPPGSREHRRVPVD
jgi:hypothetical protein